MPQLKAAAVMQPSIHLLGIHTKRESSEELSRWYFSDPIISSTVSQLHAEVRSLYGSDSFSPVSRFIKEIPEELKYEIRLAAEKEHPDQGFKPRIVGGTDVADTPFALGDRVTHNMFGEGIILNYEGQGDNARVEVNFDSGGSKWLVVSYANLEKV